MSKVENKTPIIQFNLNDYELSLGSSLQRFTYRLIESKDRLHQDLSLIDRWYNSLFTMSDNSPIQCKLDLSKLPKNLIKIEVNTYNHKTIFVVDLIKELYDCLTLVIFDESGNSKVGENLNIFNINYE